MSSILLHYFRNFVFLTLFIYLYVVSKESFSVEECCFSYSRAYCDNFEKMKIYTCQEAFFLVDKIESEYTAYRLLKKNPINKNITYLAVPWTPFINKNIDFNKVIPEIFLGQGFTICQHIKFDKIIDILKKLGINVLFTPHVEKGKVYSGITVLPMPHVAVNASGSAANKDILYSFIGYDTHPVRKKYLPLKYKGWIMSSLKNVNLGISLFLMTNRDYQKSLSMRT